MSEKEANMRRRTFISTSAAAGLSFGEQYRIEIMKGTGHAAGLYRRTCEDAFQIMILRCDGVVSTDKGATPSRGV